MFFQQPVGAGETVSAHFCDEHDSAPQGQGESTKLYPEMVQTCFRAPLVELVLQRDDEVKASGPSRALRGFSMVEEEIKASETTKRFMCLGSQLETETVFEMRRLSGSTLNELHRHPGFLKPFYDSCSQLKKLVNKTRLRLRVFSGVSKLEGKSKRNKESDAQLKEAQMR